MEDNTILIYFPSTFYILMSLQIVLDQHNCLDLSYMALMPANFLKYE